MSIKPRVQILTAKGASFKLDGDRLVAQSPKATALQVGDIVEIKTVIVHPMEPGTRKTAEGALIPRNCLTGFRAEYGGATVFTAALGPGISENPYLAFYCKVPGSGILRLEWTGDRGLSVVQDIPITVA